MPFQNSTTIGREGSIADQSPMIVDLAREARFTLADLEVRPATREVVAPDRRDVIEPRVMQVLVALGRRRGEVVSRDELIAACWRGRAVGEDAINRCIGVLRRLAETYGGFHVHTVARVGYRLGVDGQSGGADQVRPRSVLAVLPFDNLSGDADWFCDGVSEEILDAMTRVPGIKVIGRTSSFQFRGAEKALHRIARELGATHVLDGSVRRSGARVRVMAQLVECAGATTMWSSRFDRELSDAFAVQDDIAGAVAEAVRQYCLEDRHS